MNEPYHAVLVHNLGHRDVFVGLHGDETVRRIASNGQYSLGRAVCEAIDGGAQLQPRQKGGAELRPSLSLSWNNQRRQRRLLDRHDNGLTTEQAEVERLYFPLIQSAVEQIRMTIDTAALHLHVLPVSSGPPQNADTQHAHAKGKSTEYVARMIAAYIEARWPDVKVHPIHRSTSQAFTFANSPEVLREVDAEISRIRRPVVERYQEDWNKHFGVFLSVNTGTVSDISSMLEGIRPYAPSLVHISAAYRWPVDAAGQYAIPTAEILENDMLRQRPAQSLEGISSDAVRFAVKEMKNWRDTFVAARPDRAAELDSDEEDAFWFRKGKKEVLAVLVAKDPEDSDAERFVSHRAVNIEVSLPTGTLCAERNAIGSAFAAMPKLQRKHIRAVAVLSLDDGLGARIGPCGACMEWLRKVDEVNPDFRVVTFADLDCEQVYVESVQ